MSARSRGSRRKNKVRAPRSQRAPLTDVQKEREILLIKLGVTKADIARGIDEDPKNVSAVFLDKFRSLGPTGIEQRIVGFLKSVSNLDIDINTMGWPEPITTEVSNGQAKEAEASR